MIDIECHRIPEQRLCGEEIHLEVWRYAEALHRLLPIIGSRRQLRLCHTLRRLEAADFATTSGNLSGLNPGRQG
jgi:hypothetical protein